MNVDKIFNETGIRLVPATKRHVREAARIMREEDKIEVKASGAFEPEKAVRASVNRSREAWAAYAGDDLLCVFGISVFPTGWAVPWSLSTRHLPRHPFAFWKASKLIVNEYRAQHPQMVQMVHASYTAALTWVERLGFKVESPIKFGAANTLFCRVSMLTPKLEVARV